MNRMPLLLGPSLLLLAATGVSAGGEVFRCRTPDGALAFQDRPCAEAAQSLGVVQVDNAAPEPADARSAREERERIAAWERASRERLAPSLGGRARSGEETTPTRAAGSSSRRAESARSSADASCDSARAVRASAYRRDGNTMGFDRRRALDDAVTNACGLR